MINQGQSPHHYCKCTVVRGIVRIQVAPNRTGRERWVYDSPTNKPELVPVLLPLPNLLHLRPSWLHPHLAHARRPDLRPSPRHLYLQRYDLL